MTIQELANEANVTPRTVRYYVEQGILPAPERGRPSEYTEEHLRLLDLVRRLKEQYLPLEEIRDMVQRLSPDQIDDVLSRTAQQPARRETPTDSAADYIQRVLSRGAEREQLKKQARPLQTPPVPQAPQMPQTPQSPPRPQPYQPYQPYQPASPGPPQTPSPYPATYGGDSVEVPGTAGWPLPIPQAAPRTRSAPAEDAETWRRTRLAPGIELHYMVAGDPSKQGIVDRIIAAARHILAGADKQAGADVDADLDTDMEENTK